MKENKKYFRRIKKFFRRFVNGKKGAISLFMAFLMTPIMSISLLLVETARYQNVVQLMNEVIDVSAFSELANFDPYIQKRFGLFSISQKMNLTTQFNDYLNENAKAVGSSVKINNSSATGTYALSDKDILKQQLIDSSDITVLTEVLYNGINADDLLKKLSDQLKLKGLNDTMKEMEDFSEILSDATGLLNILKDIGGKYNKYIDAVDNYGKKYSDFLASIVGDSSTTGLVKAIKNAESKLEKGDKHDSIYNTSGVKNAIETFNTAKNDYKEAAKTLKTDYKDFVDKVKDAKSKVENLYKKIKNYVSGDNSKKLTVSVRDIVNTLYYKLNSICTNSFEDEMNKKCEEIQQRINALDKLNAKDIDATWNESKVSSNYDTISVSTFSELNDAIQNAINLFEGKVGDNDESLDAKDTVGLFLNIFGTFFNLKGLYDDNLDAIVNDSYLFGNTQMARSSEVVIESLSNFSEACDDLYNSWNSKNAVIKLIDMISGVAKLLTSLVEFLGAAIKWAEETIVNLVTFLSQPSEYYNALLLYGYGVYNMPNRINYSDGKTLTGYSYSDVYKNAGGKKLSKTLKDSLKSFSDIGDQTGDNKMFKGAEAEYLLVGSKSERLNQSVSFVDIYLFRLLLDIVPILKNDQVTTISSMAGPLAWLVKAAVILTEPVLDTVFLVNGESDYLIKNTVYLSFSGMIEMQKRIVRIADIPKSLKDKIQKYIDNHNVASGYEGNFKMDYKEHLLMLMVCAVNQNEFLTRLQNLVQMEAYVAGEKDSPGTNFRLEKAYTFLQTNVRYTLKPIFAIDSLTKNGYFTKSKKQYFGY